MKKLIFGVIGILVLAFTACSSSDDNVPDELIGSWTEYKYHAEWHGAKLGQIGNPEDGATLWIYTFRNDGTVLRNDNTYPYTINGNRLTINKKEYVIISLTHSELQLQYTDVSYDERFQDTITYTKKMYFKKK